MSSIFPYAIWFSMTRIAVPFTLHACFGDQEVAVFCTLHNGSPTGGQTLHSISRGRIPIISQSLVYKLFARDGEWYKITTENYLALNLALSLAMGSAPEVVQQSWRRDVTSLFPPSGKEGYIRNRDVPYQSEERRMGSLPKGHGYCPFQCPVEASCAVTFWRRLGPS